MSILWCGGEDIDFPNGASVVTSTTAGVFRTGYAREAVQPGVGTSSYSNAFSGGAITSGWMQARCYYAASGNVTNFRLFGITTSGALAKGIYVGVGSANSRLAIYKYDGTTLTKLAEETGNSLTSGAINLLTLKFSNFGSSCTINLYSNGGSAVISGTYDASISGVSNLDSVVLFTPNVNYYGLFSEVVIADEDTRGFSIVTHAPNAAGTTNDWTGAYTDINETAINDSTAVYVNMTGKDEQFNLTNLPSGKWGIKAMRIVARMAKSNSTPTTVALGYNNGGSIDAGTSQAVTTSWATYERLDNTPGYTQAQVDSLQLNLRSG